MATYQYKYIFPKVKKNRLIISIVYYVVDYFNKRQRLYVDYGIGKKNCAYQITSNKSKPIILYLI